MGNTLKPVKLNTFTSWTPAYVEQFFKKPADTSKNCIVHFSIHWAYLYILKIERKFFAQLIEDWPAFLNGTWW